LISQECKPLLLFGIVTVDFEYADHGKVSGHVRWGIRLFSDNGITNWKKYEPTVVYDHDLKYDDGSILHCVRRERPQLYIENEKIACLLTGVYDGTDSWCQPVKVCPPH